MKRIILAEDNPSIQDITRIILEGAGYEVVIHNNGEQLINGSYDLPDLYILDKQLSGVDGLDICRFLKNQESTREIPVIMLSASPTINELARDAGANDALEKPFKIKMLREMIARFIG